MNYVISLKNADERRIHIINEFKKHNLNFLFFDAITVNEVNKYAEKFKINFNNEMLTNVEKACFLSHIELYSQLIEKKLDFICVFEDDVILGRDASSFFSNYNWCPKNVDIIKVEKFEDKAFMGLKKINVGKSRYLRVLKGKHLGTAGYIVTFNGVKKIMEYISNHSIANPIDVILFEENILNGNLKILQMTPSLTIQADRLYKGILPSQIQAERSDRKIIIFKNKLSFIGKVKRESFRLLKNMWMSACKINFK
ncbi:glycosyltransferase family 25 protein [Acinetobacter schindleri]|uniref:Glycosyltransferase family 25 protein n=1 Tax=Acinetobacter schindleri TaxID=108981 RepID=A0AAE7BXM0_9GAMM|nr:glycosyltransferase family 25 protein [Acinetobacter schindleri]QIC68111.1 glycosyltransferase family 25 protein [Acinetobacter schindleri]